MEKAVVFGCGETARTYRDKIHERFDVIAYTSNHAGTWGKRMDGLEVIPPENIPEKVSIVVASKEYYPEIIYGLEKKGLTNRSVYNCWEGKILSYSPENAGSRVFEHPKIETCLTTLQLSFSGLCNSRCRYCLYHSDYSGYGEHHDHQKFMDEDILNEVVRQIESIDSLRTLLMIGTGETLMNPRWYEFASKVLSTYGRFERCVIYTNGMLLTEENVNKLKNLPVANLSLGISIDGTSPEDCEYWRKGEKFSVIRENVNRAYQILGDTVTFSILGCVVLPASLDVNSAEQVEKFFSESCEWRKKEFPFASHKNEAAMPMVDHIPGTKVVLANVFPRVCACVQPYHTIVVRPNGDIISCPCGYIFKNDAAYLIGNVKRDQIKDVFYHNKVICDLRSSFSNQGIPKLCEGCNHLDKRQVLALQKTE